MPGLNVMHFQPPTRKGNFIIELCLAGSATLTTILHLSLVVNLKLHFDTKNSPVGKKIAFKIQVK